MVGWLTKLTACEELSVRLMSKLMITQTWPSKLADALSRNAWLDTIGLPQLDDAKAIAMRCHYLHVSFVWYVVAQSVVCWYFEDSLPQPLLLQLFFTVGYFA